MTVPKTSQAARSRFLYVPEFGGLHRLPSAPWDLFTSLANCKLSRLLLSSVCREPFRSQNRPLGVADESVDGFMTRRFGSEFARVFASALVHGIYAADARQLSLRSAFPLLWEAEQRGNGSVLYGLLRQPRHSPSMEGVPYELGNVEESMQGASVFTFRDGIGTITSALVKYLRARPNVRLQGGVSITGIRIQPRNKQFEVSKPSMLACMFQYLILRS